ncbi:NADH-quinone oxidoreductase subunit A [Mycolicibacterium sp. GF69]|uniref:NADH-quinone oxidoreductase subunit A n=1 Tax=Mycolicibacterium sp. GF69 TaxID=2267251 RepID=UPI001F0CCB3E|nr:NADH-quinone oxidoreductase subunit A [Mycolicibacterium sp. GF69]
MFAAVAWMLAISLAGVAAAYGASRVVSGANRKLVCLPFQSGWLPAEHALSRYHVRWYLATLVFLAFDVEMLFMYPWAVVVAQLGVSAIVEMFVFLGALLVAVVWAWREGALRWV